MIGLIGSIVAILGWGLLLTGHIMGRESKAAPYLHGIATGVFIANLIWLLALTN